MQGETEREIRFGVVCNGNTLQRWQALCVEKLLNLQNVKLALIVVKPERESRAGRIRFHQFFLRVYSATFLRPPALRLVDVQETFAQIPRVTWTSDLRESYEYLAEKDVDAIRRHDLDFILHFGQGVLRGDVLTAARYGLWSFHLGDAAKHRGHPPGFWEIFHADSVTGAFLLRMAEPPDAAFVLKEGHFRTRDSSYAKNLQQVCSESSRWPAQVCTDLRNNQAQYLGSRPREKTAGVSPMPNNRETALFVARLAVNRLKNLYRALFRYSVWNIGVVRAHIDEFLLPGFKPRIDWFPQSGRGEFKADPFALPQDSSLLVFFENLDYHHPKGIIYAVETSGADYVTQPKSIIELPVHMSYPYAVEYKGQTYLIPETNHAKEISVYRATRFPYEWERIGALLRNVAAIDSTVFQYEGRWWLMFTDRERGGDANLYVWHAPDFWGPWQPHANNPVKSDVRSARPGGTPFVHDGTLYRPTQDCSRTGGGRTVINRVNQLSPTGFDEEPVISLEPDRNGPYPEGLHTLSRAGDFTLVDGKRFEFLPVALANNIVKGVKRVLGSG